MIKHDSYTTNVQQRDVLIQPVATIYPRTRMIVSFTIGIGETVSEVVMHISKNAFDK